MDKTCLKTINERSIHLCGMEKSPFWSRLHVAINKHYYSIPHQYLKENIDVRITATTIECFYKGTRIALHQRSYKPGHTTIHEHMPSKHQEYCRLDTGKKCITGPEYWPNTEKLIQELTHMHKIPSSLFRSCLGILRMSKTYGPKRLENACIRALHLAPFDIKTSNQF